MLEGPLLGVAGAAVADEAVSALAVCAHSGWIAVGTRRSAVRVFRPDGRELVCDAPDQPREGMESRARIAVTLLEFVPPHWLPEEPPLADTLSFREG